MSLIVLLMISFSCADKEIPPRANHVIVFGLDGVGARALQLAETPNMNKMIMNGALSINTRTVLPSNSGPSWVSMFTGTVPEHHGVRSNSWRTDNYNIEPSIKTEAGYFPSIFEHIKEQKPELKAFMLYEWGGMLNLFDESVPDRVIHKTDGVELFHAAYDVFFEEKPEFLFVAIDEPDGFGHRYGYDHPEYFRCISKYDSLIGIFIDRLIAESMLENTVILVTSDHGGLDRGHGGDSPNEMEIPVLLYGGSVTQGRTIEQVHLITDIAATAAGLLGIVLPGECRGSFIFEAFMPGGEFKYVPLPSVRPADHNNLERVTVRSVENSSDRELLYIMNVSGKIEVSINADFPDTEVFYTLDYSQPVSAWQNYRNPFFVEESDTIWAITVINSLQSKVERIVFAFLGD